MITTITVGYETITGRCLELHGCSSIGNVTNPRSPRPAFGGADGMITDQTCEPLVTDPGWCWAVRFADGTVLVHRSLLTDRVPDVLAPVRDAVHGLVLVMSEEEPPTPDMFGRTVWEWWGPGPREP